MKLSLCPVLAFAITKKDDCPGPLALSVDGHYVEADLQFYLTVNGVEQRPNAGGVFHGKYSDYKEPYAVCLP